MKPRSILIVGGGTAGWLTAASLARHFGSDQTTSGPRITVLESPDIGTIGVGEGTFPTIIDTLSRLGIDEAAFMRESSATFKQGIRFDEWERPGTHYFHPFEPPYFGPDDIDLTYYWLLQAPATRPSWAEAVTFQKPLADASLGPKHLGDKAFEGPLKYAYHFDAVRFAGFLARHARRLGVRHLTGTVTHVELDEDGAIRHVVSDSHGTVEADFFIDCTGFRSELLGKALGVPFKTIDDVLFTDRAVAIQVPYETPDAPIPSYTLSTAHEAGWTWDIGLDQRRGIGYVYSSSHSDDDRAEAVLRAYAGPAAEGLEARRIRFQAGYRERQWVKNCIAIGLSAGFLEPLEATGIIMIEAAINRLMEYFPHGGPPDASAGRFNLLMNARYANTIAFIKLHYCLTRREEPFWRDNTRPESIPDHLRELLDIWTRRPPERYDFMLDHETFSHVSYQAILYGMNYPTDFEAARPFMPRARAAESIFTGIRGETARAMKTLPSHRKLIAAVYEGRTGMPSNPGLLTMNRPK